MNYVLENISDGVVVLRKESSTLELRAKAQTVISEKVIDLFKDQISVLVKEKKILKLYPQGEIVTEEDKKIMAKAAKAKAEAKLKTEKEAKLKVELENKKVEEVKNVKEFNKKDEK